MENNNEKNVENLNDTSELQEFIEVLITDDEMKEKFIADPEEVLKNYKLNESQRLLLMSLEQEDIMKLSPENVEEFFSADSAVYTPEIDDDLLDSNSQGEDDLL